MKTNGCLQRYPEYWGQARLPVEDAANMRDDTLGLAAMRMFPDAVFSPTSAPSPASPAQALAGPAAASRPSNFAAELARASKRYASPLKQQQNPSAHASSSAPKAKLHKPATSSTLTGARSPSTVNHPLASKPALPVQRPPATQPPIASASSTPMALDAYPHPNGDNGRGMHWVPTTKQSHAVVDRFVAEAQRMGVKWVTFLNEGANVGQNDYLVNKLVGAGIEPVMRLYSPKLEPIQGDVEDMVRHYVGMGVRYFQPYNEPNLSVEQPDGVPSVERYLNAWIPAAQAIVRGGGLPGFGSLAPGGDMSDIDFLTQAVDGLKARGQLGLLDRGWLSMHNYTHNHPIQERADTDGFFKFRAYHKILHDALGRDLPIIGTEGGTFVGEHEDTTLPAVDSATAVSMASQAYRYMRDQREPWNFAYSFWTIANEAGGGSDTAFSQEALFNADGSASPIVGALRALG